MFSSPEFSIVRVLILIWETISNMALYVAHGIALVSITWFCYHQKGNFVFEIPQKMRYPPPLRGTRNDFEEFGMFVITLIPKRNEQYDTGICLQNPEIEKPVLVSQCII